MQTCLKAIKTQACFSIQSLDLGDVIGIWEEVKPGLIQNIEPLQTTTDADLQNGDILCIQPQLIRKTFHYSARRTEKLKIRNENNKKKI